MKIILALIIFSVIIIIHELGHFLLAKKNGITVTEFSLGMGPRLLSTKRGGTLYSLKALPFGGSCQMVGEDESSSEEGAFSNKSVWARMSVIAAGPIFNFILAFVMALFLIGGIGHDEPVIEKVMEGYPAAEAGVLAGDRITKMNGSSIHVYREVTNFSTFHQGEKLELEYERDGERYETTLTPKKGEDGHYLYGFQGSGVRKKGSTWETIKYGAYEVKYWIVTTFQSLGMLVRGQVKADDVAGPVGIVDAIGDTYEQSRSSGWFAVWINLLNMAILLSANLGVMNLLPIPALDGGRLVFLIVEAIRGKRINPEKEGMVHLAGLMVLMVLMVFIMFNDIRKLF